MCGQVVNSPLKCHLQLCPYKLKRDHENKILRVIIINQLRTMIKRVVALVTYYGLLLA